jgi:hypothetical protein
LPLLVRCSTIEGMTIPVKRVILAVSLAALAVPVVAQNGTSASKKTNVHAATPKRVTGEAATLETKETAMAIDERAMREDNRGRLTSAHRAQHPQNRSTKATVKNTVRNHTAAHLQTGQLTTKQKNLLKTRKTALTHSVRSNGTGGKLTQKQTQIPELRDTSTIHLKKHNARMF